MPLPCKYTFPLLSRWRIRDASPLSYYTAYPFTSTNTINPTKMMRPTNLWARKKRRSANAPPRFAGFVSLCFDNKDPSPWFQSWNITINQKSRNYCRKQLQRREVDQKATCARHYPYRIDGNNSDYRPSLQGQSSDISRCRKGIKTGYGKAYRQADSQDIQQPFLSETKLPHQFQDAISLECLLQEEETHQMA